MRLETRSMLSRSNGDTRASPVATLLSSRYTPRKRFLVKPYKGSTGGGTCRQNSGATVERTRDGESALRSKLSLEPARIFSSPIVETVYFCDRTLRTRPLRGSASLLPVPRKPAPASVPRLTLEPLLLPWATNPLRTSFFHSTRQSEGPSEMPHLPPTNTPAPIVYAFEAGVALTSTVTVAPGGLSPPSCLLHYPLRSR